MWDYTTPNEYYHVRILLLFNVAIGISALLCLHIATCGLILYGYLHVYSYSYLCDDLCVHEIGQYRSKRICRYSNMITI